VSCSECFNRRQFLTRSALAAAALVVVDACGDGQIGPPTHSGSGDPDVPSGGPFTITIAQFAGLATVGTVVDIGHQRAVVRTGDSTFIALSEICTHEQCDTAVTNNRFECPCHGSIFAADGSVIRGPSTGESITPLRQLDVVFNQSAGTLTVS
jgi:cytochrome b6-f complex iron-sulfur subunit